MDSRASLRICSPLCTLLSREFTDLDSSTVWAWVQDVGHPGLPGPPEQA